MSARPHPSTDQLPVTQAELVALEEQLWRLRSGRVRIDPLSESGGDAGADAERLTTNRRIMELEHALARAAVVRPGADGFAVAAIGTAVLVDDGRKQRRYRLSLEPEPGQTGTVSATSPVGAALLGQAIGSTVRVALPDGRERELRVVGIGDDA
ncbi:GreA/GreB family elongation factor [Patulibacter defluvii]|uniref:GreA/GreB family elongation factor n=1 Tax=Patulibacter defluvii TaxID=3095358 RepID=UPI002A759212|nr:GreA/GreB family elongation factor [Patulibacter sp. DM4]